MCRFARLSLASSSESSLQMCHVRGPCKKVLPVLKNVRLSAQMILAPLHRQLSTCVQAHSRQPQVSNPMSEQM